MQEQICQILKEIIPELQQKIREQIKQQYEQRVSQLSNYYESQIQKLIQRQKQLQETLEKNIKETKTDSNMRETQNQELYKRVAILQTQRKNWCKLQLHYQVTIQQLITLLSTSQNKKTQNEIILKKENYNANMMESKVSQGQKIHPPPRSNYDIYKSFKKLQNKQQNKQKFPKQQAQKEFRKVIDMPMQIDRNQKLIKVNNDTSNINNESEIIEQPLNKYLKMNDQSRIRPENQNPTHYHSVLSPPKEQQTPKNTKGAEKNKSGELKNKLFWNQDKKKQLLSLIKLN